MATAVKAPLAQQPANVDPLDPSTWTVNLEREMPQRTRSGKEPSPYIAIVAAAWTDRAVVEIPFALSEKLASSLASKLRAEAKRQGLQLQWRKDTLRNAESDGKRPADVSFWIWTVSEPTEKEAAS